MQVVARASKGYSVRILIMVGLCAVFTVWFAYDGWWNWPARNDGLVQKMKDHPSRENEDPADRQILAEWPGMARANADQVKEMGALATRSHVDGWKTETDLFWQKVIVAGLIAATGGTIYFYLRYTRQRAIADDNGLSPAPDVQIPWANITKIDNTQWEKRGIVTITYKDAGGTTQTATLDDYDLDNLPAVLEEVANHATGAEFDPPLEPVNDTAPAA